jgi:site-specific DNA-methyltransferase (adenine-specific)
MMGSGTTGKMAKILNRNFIGIEKEPEYFEIAKQRIQSARKKPAQLSLLEAQCE